MRQDRFFTIEDGQRMVTMLFICLVAIEITDVVFALDSIPAVLSITRHPFLAYTSNIMAVMGLRSLYFLLAHLLVKLRFLHYGLAIVLAFAAFKMLAASWVDIGPLTSLAVILGTPRSSPSPHHSPSPKKSEPTRASYDLRQLPNLQSSGKNERCPPKRTL